MRFRSIRSLFFLQAAIGLSIVFFGFATSNRVVQFHYPRAIQNDPLLAPVAVRSVVGNTLHLADGRAIEIDTTEPLDQLISRSDCRVDLEFEGTEVLVYINHRGWLCGTPWAALIEIPLIRDDVPINRRAPIGVGHLVAAQSPQQSTPAIAREAQ